MESKKLYKGAGTLYKGPSTFQVLRFPIVFGGVLVLMGLTYAYRKELVDDLTEERAKMYRENPETRIMVQEHIARMKRTHGVVD